MTLHTVDVLVLGGGPAGLVAAIRAGDLGARTALVTRDAFGGMFVGATLLALGYQIFTGWVATNPDAPRPHPESGASRAD